MKNILTSNISHWEGSANRPLPYTRAYRCLCWACVIDRGERLCPSHPDCTTILDTDDCGRMPEFDLTISWQQSKSQFSFRRLYFSFLSELPSLGVSFYLFDLPVPFFYGLQLNVSLLSPLFGVEPDDVASWCRLLSFTPTGFEAMHRRVWWLSPGSLDSRI